MLGLSSLIGKNLRGVMRIFFYFMIFILSLCSSKVSADIRALILIVASDNEPIYAEFQKIWRSYMHLDPEHIEVYFVKADPNLSSKVQIVGDTIWCQTTQEYDGIILKTLYALESMLPAVLNRFDYVLRTNLSTFCIFPRFLDYLRTLPKTGCFSGTGLDAVLASGNGLIFSSDIAEFLVANQDNVLNHIPSYLGDDGLISDFLYSRGIRLIPHKFMLWVPNFKEWENIKVSIPSNIFQVRVRTENRIPDDQIIHSDLLHMFYLSKQLLLDRLLPLHNLGTDLSLISS